MSPSIVITKVGNFLKPFKVIEFVFLFTIQFIQLLLFFIKFQKYIYAYDKK